MTTHESRQDAQTSQATRLRQGFGGQAVGESKAQAAVPLFSILLGKA